MTDTNKQTGLLLVISGPSGVGKTTITREVIKRLDAQFSISMTTRPQTQSDTDGLDYMFVTEDIFKQHIENNDLLEWAEVFGNHYGTPRKPVDEALASGRIMILEIDVQGAIDVKKNMPDAYGVFILPPHEDVLLKRLRDRAREDEAIIQKRFNKAKLEITMAKESNVYDLFVVNDVLEDAITKIVTAVKAEQTKRNA
ncbi:MAG TPA: guanylate kinase [Phycisphaerales bacterium]|nr:guanylate kinase [Phycisphaerales bacterium]HCD32095.1 guanylate kinase [Phycisphaerales bacterium]|tara:strand:+ start:1585 stop:2178 length:594 start_codon:yes stop_codon:yes gene_type:complete